MLNRFFFDGAFERGATIALEGEEFHHAARVHRTREGDEIELFDGKGNGVVAAVRAIGRESLTAEIHRRVEEVREAAVTLEIAAALIQLEKFELVLQKGTELGAASFVPVTTARTEIRPERVAGKRDRWEKILLEAAKQSGRTVVPRLEETLPFEAALARPGVSVVMDPSGTLAVPEHDSLRIVVGPEGGFAEDELDAARAMGAQIWCLGTRRLRAETAAIAAAAKILL